MDIRELVDKYESNREDFLDTHYNETLLRNDFLNPFFELLGWDITNTESKPTNQREVILEEGLRLNFNENTKKPDYTFRLFSERKFFLEAKKPSVAIHTSTVAAKQIRRYGYTARLKISVISNFEYLIIYDCSERIKSTDSYLSYRLKKYHYTEYVDNFSEIVSLLGKNSVYSGQFDENFKSIELQLEQYGIDKLFLAEINTWRKTLGTEIFNHMPNISNQDLNDWTQNYLNRILFLRVCEDRNIEHYETLLHYANQNDFNLLLNKFREADQKYNSGLFDQPLCNEIIENISSVFWHIIRQLYYPESSYSFSILSSDILGNIYELFLTEKLFIENGAVLLKAREDHIDRDIVTTPTYIIEEILRQAVVPYIENKSLNSILTMRMADIACGSGSFLLELFQLLQDTLVDYFLQNAPEQLISFGIGNYKLPFSLKKNLLLNCVYGIDKDFNAVEATKFGLLLKLLEGEDHLTLGAELALLPDLSNNIFFGNSLLSPSEVENDTERREINPFDWGEMNFDIIVGNPPYMKCEDMNKITPFEFPLFKNSFVTAFKQFDKYFLFIEQSLKLLKNNGVLGYIIPNKFVKNGSAIKLRKLLQQNGYLKKILSFGANQVFKSKTTYTCILVASKCRSNSFIYSEIRNLSNWKAGIRENLTVEPNSTNELDNEVWVLIHPNLRTLYETISSQSVPLGDLIGDDNIFNGIQTSANKIYVHDLINKCDRYSYFNLDNRTWKVENELTRPYFRTSRGIANLNTYRPFSPNCFVIYPYIRTLNGVELVDIEMLRSKYPFTYQFLSNYKEALSSPDRDIKPIPTTQDEWYRYGRHQSLFNCDVPQKIIVGVLSLGNKYAIDLSRTLVSSGGTAGYCVITPNSDSLYSIYYIQAILNSKYVEWFSSIYGEVFRGGYIARGTKVIKRLPIRKIDFDDIDEQRIHDTIVNIQQRLISLQSEIDLSQNNRRTLGFLKAEFNRQKVLMDNTLASLYQLENEDSNIPSISEIYETH